VVSQRFRKKDRLTGKKEFRRLFKAKKRAVDRNMVVYVVPNELSWSRIGTSTSKRVGNAVCRNRIRRRVREAFRKNREHLPVGFDVVCIIRPGADSRSVSLCQSLLRLFKESASGG